MIRALLDWFHEAPSFRCRVCGGVDGIHGCSECWRKRPRTAHRREELAMDEKPGLVVDGPALRAARAKYVQLGREIGSASVSDLTHTHSKLGIFLDQALGAAWREQWETEI